MLLTCIHNVDDVLTAINKINQKIKQWFEIKGKNYNLRASIGYSMYPEHGAIVETLIIKADKAMYSINTNNKAKRLLANSTS